MHAIKIETVVAYGENSLHGGDITFRNIAVLKFKTQLSINHYVGFDFSGVGRGTGPLNICKLKMSH